MSAPNDVKEVVREKYSQAALRVTAGQSGCCSSAPRATDCCDPITSNLYDAGQAGEVPAAALKASLGCGNPTALAESDYKTKLATAGFGNIDVEVTRVYGSDDAQEFLSAEGLDAAAMANEVDGKFVSAFIRAVKPEP